MPQRHLAMGIKRLWLTMIVIGLLLFSAVMVNEIVMSKKNQLDKNQICILENNDDLNATVLFDPISFMGLDVHNNIYLYEQNKTSVLPKATTIGMEESVPTDGLENILLYFKVNHYDELIDKLGQFMFYHRYEEGTIYVFYDHYTKQDYTLSILVERGEKITHHSFNNEKFSLPMHACRDEQYYYVVSGRETPHGLGVVEEPIYDIYYFDLAKGDMEIMTFQAKGFDYDGHFIDSFAEEGKIYFLVSEYISPTTAEVNGIQATNLIDSVLVVDVRNETVAKVKLDREDCDFIFRDKGELHWGKIEKESDELIIRSNEGEKRIALNLNEVVKTYAREAFYHQGQLYLEIEAENEGGIKYWHGVLVADVWNETVVQAIAFQDEVTPDVVSVRYLYQAADGCYYDWR